MDFPTTLKTLLDNKDMTQADLSRSSGIPTSLISNYAKGSKTPTLTNSILLAKALGVTLDELAGIADTSTERDANFILLCDAYAQLDISSRDKLVAFAQGLAAAQPHEVTISNSDAG